MRVSIAVISDLHCHPSREKLRESLLFSDAPRNPHNNNPIEALIELIRQHNLHASVLLVPGDFTNRINQQGLLSVWPWLKEIQAALGASILAGTLGNHDVDSRGTHGQDPFIARTYYNDFPVTEPNAVNSFWTQGYFVSDLNGLRILGINSVAHHHSVDQAEAGGISQQQLDLIRTDLSNRPPATFKVALTHHHPQLHEDLGLGTYDIMENGSVLMNILRELDFDIVIHGHKHCPRLIYAQGGNDSVVVFAAGSFSALLSSIPAIPYTNTRNLFHILELDDDPIPDCRKHGLIKSWEFNIGRGWNAASSQSAQLPYLTGYGCRINPVSLAEQTAEWYQRQNQAVVTWSMVIAAIPCLNYVIPSDFQRYGTILRDTHGLELSPIPPDIPRMLGRPYSGGQ